MKEEKLKTVIAPKIVVTNNKLERKIHPFEIAKAFGAIPMGKVDYYTAKNLYHTPGFKEEKQKEMDEYFKAKDKKWDRRRMNL